jgi:tetratricopeptide (TPR) repeat protein
MPLPRPSTPRLWPTATGLVLVLAALMGGWWLGRSQAPLESSTDPRRAALAKEASELTLSVEEGEATAAQKQRLLEVLVGLDRKQEAIRLLEPMADQEPDRWSLRLMLAELRRDQKDLAGAERELRSILNRKSDQVEALQLMTLLRLEQGRGSEAEAAVRKAYGKATKPTVQPQGLSLGLLLAELQQRRKQPEAAKATYLRLAGEFPADQRPLLALALLLHGQGNGKGAQEALAQARLRSDEPNKPDPLLDRVAAAWGLETLRNSGSKGSPQQPAKSQETQRK